MLQSNYEWDRRVTETVTETLSDCPEQVSPRACTREGTGCTRYPQWIAKSHLAGRAYNRAKQSHGGQKPNEKGMSTDGHPFSGDEVATDTGIKATTLKRYAKRAEVYDMIENEYGGDSDQARERP